MAQETQTTLTILREALAGTEYEGRLWMVGGYVRDKLLGREVAGKLEDIDLVIENSDISDYRQFLKETPGYVGSEGDVSALSPDKGDGIAVARFLHKRRVADHKPVIFPNFGTAMIHVAGAQVELVTARSETYRRGSRKPFVMLGTLETDALRRDFTINTFIENLHTGEVRDPTGKGRADLEAKLLRTPLDSVITFTDDPLRMLRACRFAAKLGFEIETETYTALSVNAFRLSPEYGISFERIRDELTKTLMAPGAARGLEAMRETGLLAQFAPELVAMHGVTQNAFHLYDVWEHTLVALTNLDPKADLCVRLAVLLHDVGKPLTRTVGEDGNVHFYEHEKVGAEMAKAIMTRLKFSSDEISRVVALVGFHMRYGAYKPDEWTDASLRRLIRTVGEHRQDLFTIALADISACNTETFPTADLEGLSERMEQLEAEAQITKATSPLTGQEIMELLNLPPGPMVGRIKDALTDAVVAGELAPDDKVEAERRARKMLEDV